MSPNEEKLICKLNDKISHPIKLTLFETEHEKNKAFVFFCEKLSQLVPQIQFVKADGDFQSAPMIGIGNGIRYQAIPTGTELEPFLEALAFNDSSAINIPKLLQKSVCDIEIPAVLTIYVAPQCKFCPEMVRQLIPLPELNRNIKLIIIDCTQFPELMQQYKIQSVPTLFLDDHFHWTGSVNLEELIGMMKDRDPSLLGAVSQEMILKEGNAAQLAQMMLEENIIFPAFYDVLTHDKWSVRLGAMVVMEEITRQQPALAAQAIKPLWERFFEVSDQVKGDILYIFGEIGESQALAKLKSVLSGKFGKEVKEAAEEALQKIKK
ncbi:MAG: thioredoxin family protein [Desulfobacterales bacterium]|jgi:glutaredoxin